MVAQARGCPTPSAGRSLRRGSSGVIGLLIGDALELGYAATVHAYQAVIATAFEPAPG